MWSITVEIGTLSENTGEKINYICCLLGYFWLWIIENRSLNSQNFVTTNMKCKFGNLSILGRCSISGMWPENQDISAFSSSLSGFCPHGSEMVLHLLPVIPRKEERRCVHSMRINDLGDLSCISLLKTVPHGHASCKGVWGTNHFNLAYCYPEENQGYEY